MAQKADKKSIVFVHPDLGIGGAERLVIDAAVGLQSCGHKITILTSYRDKNHCFDEARDGRLCSSPRKAASQEQVQSLQATKAKYHSRNTRRTRAWRQYLPAIATWPLHDPLRNIEAGRFGHQHEPVLV